MINRRKCRCGAIHVWYRYEKSAGVRENVKSVDTDEIHE